MTREVYLNSVLEVINTDPKHEIYGVMHSAAQPWAVARSTAPGGEILKILGRYATKAGAQRRMNQLNRKPGQG